MKINFCNTQAHKKWLTTCICKQDSHLTLILKANSDSGDIYLQYGSFKERYLLTIFCNNWLQNIAAIKLVWILFTF